MKPTKPGELRGVTVNAISLVSKAANGKRYKFFKSADAEDRPMECNTAREELQKHTAPEEVKKDERGLFHILKEFFTGTNEAIEKGAVEDTLNAKEAGRKLSNAFDALMKVLGLSRYDYEQISPETDSAKIVSAIDDFRNIAIETLLSKSEIEKSGRKISGSRLSKLRDIQALLNDVLSDIDNIPEEAEEVTKEEIQKIVEDVVKSVNGVQETGNVPAETVSKADVQKAIDEGLQKLEITKAIKMEIDPLMMRIERLEKARGFSNRVPEETTVEKNANDFWGGIF